MAPNDIPNKDNAKPPKAYTVIIFFSRSIRAISFLLTKSILAIFNICSFVKVLLVLGCFDMSPSRNVILSSVDVDTAGLLMSLFRSSPWEVVVVAVLLLERKRKPCVDIA